MAVASFHVAGPGGEVTPSTVDGGKCWSDIDAVIAVDVAVVAVVAVVAEDEVAQEVVMPASIRPLRTMGANGRDVEEDTVIPFVEIDKVDPTMPKSGCWLSTVPRPSRRRKLAMVTVMAPGWTPDRVDVALRKRHRQPTSARLG